MRYRTANWLRAAMSAVVFGGLVLLTMLIAGPSFLPAWSPMTLLLLSGAWVLAGVLAVASWMWSLRIGLRERGIRLPAREALRLARPELQDHRQPALVGFAHAVATLVLVPTAAIGPNDALRLASLVGLFLNLTLYVAKDAYSRVPGVVAAKLGGPGPSASAR